jgi:hypothetical protein
METARGAARARGRRLLRGLGRTWLAVGATLAVLSAAEGLARLAVAARGRPPDPRIRADAYPREPWVAELYEENGRSARMRWEPYLYWRRRPFAGRYIRIDARGLRHTWRPPEPAGRPAASAGGGAPLRIFVFGASPIWGTGVRDDHTVPSELARYLAAAGVAAEVENFGESGYVSTQDVIALLRELQRGNVPDLAVFYLGSNDAFSTFQNRTAGAPMNEEHRAREFNLLQQGRRLAGEALRAFAARSALLRLAGFELAASGGSPERWTPGPGLVDDTLRALDANLLAADGLAARYGFRNSFFWEASLLEKRRQTPYERSCSAAPDPARGWVLATLSRVERDWAARDPDEFTDLGDLFAEASGPLYIDRAHLGEEGNRRVAAAIGRQLLGHGRLRRRRRPPDLFSAPRPAAQAPALPRGAAD